MPNIKLQMLLQHADLGADRMRALEAALAKLDIQITSVGRASLSGEISTQRFAELFGAIPQLQSGFSADAASAVTLPVPEELKQDIALLTMTPRHIPLG